MSIEIYSKNVMLNHLSGDIPMYVGAFESTGVELQTGGRKQLTFPTSATNGVVAGVLNEDLTIPAGKVVSEIIVWNDLTGGDMILRYLLDTPETFANEGALSVDTITISLN